VAGTVYPTPSSGSRSGVLDAHVQIRDAGGWSFEVQTNVAGNFYTAESVAFPLQVCVVLGGAATCMSAPVDYGGCNACHAQPPAGGAPGRVAVP